MYGDAERSSYLWTTESVLLNFLLYSEATKLNNPSKISVPNPVPSSANESSKILLTEYPSGWNFCPNPPNVLPTLRSPYRPPFPHTTPQSQNVPIYHFHLGIISADDQPSPHYEDSPQVFQLSQQNFTMNGHQTDHYLFYQTISLRLWQYMNQEVHLCHLPYLLSQYFCQSLN